MNGDWNSSNNLKKTCSDFTLAVGVQREMGLGFFRDLDIAEMGLGIFEGSKLERGGELSLVSRVLILAYIVNEIF